MWERKLDDISRRREFRELLPFYVNGTLDDLERKRIEAYLAEHPGARDEYLFTERLARTARLHGDRRDPMAGYAQLKARLDAARPAPPSLAERWRERLRAWGLSPALALTLALAGTQLVVTGAYLLPAREEAMTRGIAAPQQRAQLKLTVRRGAAYGDVVALLAREHCHIVWGPSESGELWLVLDEPRDAPRVRQLLAQSPLVEDVLELVQP